MRVGVSYEAEAPLDAAAAEAAARAALAEGGLGAARGALELVFVDDARLAELHARFLDDPSPTDVMAFDLGEEDDEAELEVWVSVDRARDVAGARGVPVARELALYVVHGVLHLTGHDDHEDADRARMRAAEARVMDALGYPRDDAPHEFVGE
ncbi:MAG: rRNA maturation RNase YbeY [Planctomycetes bacterium]|nr:rRNA maturation RNase YbeY [Planctomycetota bacterium]